MAPPEPQPSPIPAPRRAAAPQAPTRPPPGGARVTAGRPAYFPSAFAWLGVGVGRNWRGAAVALVSTWFGLPLALLAAALSAVVVGLFGVIGGTVAGRWWFPPLIADLPLLGPAVDALVPRAGGVLGGVVGLLLGLVLGFLGTLALLSGFALADDPVAGAGSALGVVVFGLFVGFLYMLYRVVFERVLLRASGARRMSRREHELITPIAQSCARRLGLANHPRILVDDSPEPRAAAYTRHLVINHGLLEEFEYDPEVIAGVICHGLVHWRNGDAVAAAFVRGVALPLYAVHAAAGWFVRRVAHPLVPVLVWLVLWPVMITVRFLVMPAQARDSRAAEYRADQGAVLAGHRDGMRRVLVRLRHSFEGGRNGWDEGVGATHPPNELRLERLEDPADPFPLPDPDRAAGQRATGEPG